MSNEYSLAIVQPIEITDTMLLSSTVAETDHGAWASGTTYDVDDRVILTSTHRIYESLSAGNTGNNPASSPDKWVEVSPTNRWKAFDSSNTTQTKQATSIYYKLKPGVMLSTVAALNVTNATSLIIKMTDPVEGVVYDRTVSFDGVPSSASWWLWFFGKRRVLRQYIALDLPSQMPDAEIEITLTGGSDLGVGVILLGMQERYGLGAQYGSRVGIRSYSRQEPNEFGDIVPVKRPTAKWSSFTLPVANDELDALYNTLADLDAIPCLWIISDRFESMQIYGLYKDFEAVIAYPAFSECELRIEGLT